MAIEAAPRFNMKNSVLEMKLDRGVAGGISEDSARYVGRSRPANLTVLGVEGLHLFINSSRCQGVIPVHIPSKI